MRSRFLSPAKCFWAILLTVALCYSATIALPYNPEQRYLAFEDTIYKRAIWIFDRIHHDPTPIDVVFLGTSRTATGVLPTLIEPALAQRGQKLHVVNFAIPASGYDVRESLAEEVLSAKRVKLLVIDVVEQFPRDGHPAFGDMATVSQILHAPVLVNRNLPRNLLRLPVRQINYALASIAPEAYGVRSHFDSAKYKRSSVNASKAFVSEEGLDQLGTTAHILQLEAQSRRRYLELTPPLLPPSLHWVEFGVSETYIKRLVAMAHKHNVKVAFLFIPFYKGPHSPEEEAWLRRLAPVWKANLMAGDPRNYYDSGHASANPASRKAMANWLADQITATLATEPAKQR